MLANNPTVQDVLEGPLEQAWDGLARALPGLDRYPRLYGAAGGLLLAGCGWLYLEQVSRRAMKRASSLQYNIRVVKQRRPELVASLLGQLFLPGDTTNSIRCVGGVGDWKCTAKPVVFA